MRSPSLANPNGFHPGAKHTRTPSLPGPVLPTGTMTAAEAAATISSSQAAAIDPRMLMLAPSAIGGLTITPVGGGTGGGRMSADGAATAVATGSLWGGGKGVTSASGAPEASQPVGLYGQLDPLQWLLQELVNLLLVLSQVCGKAPNVIDSTGSCGVTPRPSAVIAVTATGRWHRQELCLHQGQPPAAAGVSGQDGSSASSQGGYVYPSRISFFSCFP